MKAKKSIFLLLMVVLLISCAEPTIDGKITDNFNQPIPNADVKIEGSSIKTTTNSDGEYSINFIPGNNIKVLFSKQGYMDSEINLNISAKESFPAETVSTYKIPVENGFFIIGENDYINIPKTNVKSKKKKFLRDIRMFNDGGFGWTGPCTFEGYTYFADINEENIPSVNKGDINFVSTFSEKITLVKLRKNNDDYQIAEIHYPTEAKLHRGRGYGYAYYTWNTNSLIFKRNVSKKYYSSSFNFENLLDNNGKGEFSLAEKKLKKGYYAFCKMNSSPKKVIETDFIFAFKVE